MSQMIDKGKVFLKDQIKPEMHQSVVEVGTNICSNINEARAEVINLRANIAKLAKDSGLTIAAAVRIHSHTGTLLNHRQSQIPSDIDEMQMTARANLIFVHYIVLTA